MIAQTVTLSQKIEANRTRHTTTSREAMIAKSQAAWDQEDQEILAEIQSGNASPAFIALYGPQVGIVPDPTPEPPVEYKVMRFDSNDEALTYWQPLPAGTTRAQAIDAARQLDRPTGEYHEVHAVINDAATVVWSQDTDDDDPLMRCRYCGASSRFGVCSECEANYDTLPPMGGGAHTADEIEAMAEVVVEIVNDCNKPVARLYSTNPDNAYYRFYVYDGHCMEPASKLSDGQNSFIGRNARKDAIDHLTSMCSGRVSSVELLNPDPYNNLPPIGGGSHALDNRATSQKRDNDRAERHAINEAYHAHATNQAQEVAAFLAESDFIIGLTTTAGDGTPIAIWNHVKRYATIKQTPYTIKIYNGNPEHCGKNTNAKLTNRIQHGWCQDGEATGYAAGIVAALLPLLETPDPLMQAIEAQEAYAELYGSIEEARNEPTDTCSHCGKVFHGGSLCDLCPDCAELDMLDQGEQFTPPTDEDLNAIYGSDVMAHVARMKEQGEQSPTPTIEPSPYAHIAHADDYILWGYPTTYTLPAPEAIKLDIGSMKRCKSADKSYSNRFQTIILKRGESWEGTSLGQFITAKHETPALILTGGQPTMTGPWTDTSDPYSNLPAIGGGSQENDTEDDMITTTYSAEQLAAAFYTADNGRLCIKDDNEEVAEIVKAMVFAADQSGLGWDFAYIAVNEALDYINDTECDVNDDLDTHDFADNAVSVYSADLIRWLNDSPLNHMQLCDEARDDTGMVPESLVQYIALGQYHAYELAMQAVISNWPEA